jgi:hypothetical protein
MYIETVPNRNSPPCILLRESFRQDGKVKHRTLTNLSQWPLHLVLGATEAELEKIAAGGRSGA